MASSPSYPQAPTRACQKIGICYIQTALLYNWRFAMLSIVDCPCFNPLPHKRFLLQIQKDGLDFLSPGIFSVTGGKNLLSTVLTDGQINEDDLTAIEPDLISCGLPEKEPTAEATADKNSDYTLVHFAITLITSGLTPHECTGNIILAIAHGFLSGREATVVKEYLQKTVEDLRKIARS